MSRRSMFGLASARLAATAVVATAVVSGGLAQGTGPVSPSPVQTVVGPAKELTLTVGEGELYRTVAPFAKVSVTDDRIVDVTPQSDREFLLSPKALGSTDVFVLDARNALLARLDITVVKARRYVESQPEAPKDGLVRVYTHIYDKGTLALPVVYHCDPKGCELISEAPEAAPAESAQAPAPANAAPKDANPR